MLDTNVDEWRIFYSLLLIVSKTENSNIVQILRAENISEWPEWTE